MKNRGAVLLLTALGFAAGVAAPAEPVALIAWGTVLKKDANSLVIRTDDHGHRIAFDISGQTVVPEGLAVGRHVQIDYHANGPTGQTADRVTLVEARRR
jgi:hypothetical protein